MLSAQLDRLIPSSTAAKVFSFLSCNSASDNQVLFQTPENCYKMWEMDTRRTRHVSGNVETRSCTHCCRGKGASVKYSLYSCVSHPVRKSHFFVEHYIVLWFVWLYSGSILSHKRHYFRGRQLLNIKCVLIFSATFVCNISHAKAARYYHVCISAFKVPVILVRF
jgi:hypothetical protein